MRNFIKKILFVLILLIYACDIIQDKEQNFHDEYCNGDLVQLWDESYSIYETTELILDSLGGIIPPQIGCFENLKKIDLSYSSLQGDIPPEIGNLLNLIELNLIGNDLSGEIPAQIGNLTSLSTLILSHNQLTGEIPSQIGGLYNLVELRLSNNQLIGEIPTEIINFENLTILDLKVNQLSYLPTNICSLNLNFNNFTNVSFLDNHICPPYPECISLLDISTQNTSSCP